MRIEGRNPVREALRAGHPIRRIVVATGAGERGSLAEILELARAAGVRVDRVERRALDEQAETGAHQGVVAEAADFRYRPWQDAVEEARARGETPLLVALDGVTDPQNAGSLARSAYGFGAHAMLLPGRRSALVTATVAKASAGAVWHLAVDQVTNLERTLAECKKQGLWVAGLDAEGDVPVSNCPVLSEPLALVIGSEGAGLSRLIRERADVLVTIPQTGRIGSLNASIAGAIALYEASRSRALSGSGTQLSGSEGEAKRT